ncbi:MAG: glycoside hydrolase family 76 protein [Fimbriimonadaceae bacterium]|nr:glycoside hydrolase family 76 protein [Fimbriimonadaceae bacterium]
MISSVALVLELLMPQDFNQEGIQTLELIQREFRPKDSPHYLENTGPGAKKEVLFNWGVGVLISAMNGAAKADPKWRKTLRDTIESTRAYWNPAKPVPGYDVWPMPKPADRYYDDNAWMVLALVEASDILSEPKFLDYAKETLTFVLSGEDEKLGGGIYWRENEKMSKNTCSNGPSAAACLAVYERTKDRRLLDKAIALYDWTRRNLQDPAGKLFWDSISLSGKIDKTKWSYNTALMIRTAAELGRITGKETYREEAKAMAAASEAKWLVNGRFADEGKFAHLLLESWTYVPNKERMKRASQAMKWLITNAKNEQGFYGHRFDVPSNPKQEQFALIDQASAARAFFIVGQAIGQN